MPLKKTAKTKKTKAPKAKAGKKSKTVVRTAIASVPKLTLPATGGQTVALGDLGGRKVVLYFYPKDMTPGCTIEGHDFTRLKKDFTAQNAVVFGVSRDSLKSHEKFKEKECYTIDLLSDEDEKLCKAFGVIKDKNMYGRIVRGIERSTFVIDENGRVAKEWRGVRVDGHAAEVLNFVKGLS